MPPPEFYDDWDPDEHDRGYERLQNEAVRLWNADLRNLQSEHEAERDEARRAAKPDPLDYRAIREAFEADNPKPDDDDFEGCAEWEWRRLEHLYQTTDRVELLHQHRMERGSYVERHAASLRRAKEWVDELFRPFKERPPTPGGWEPIPWPDGDGVTGWRIRFAESGGYDHYPEGALDEPSVDAVLDLDAGSLGWFQSLYEDEREPSKAFRKVLDEIETHVRRSYRAEYLPGHVGGALLSLRRAVLLAQDALDMLDGFRGYEWMTARAYDRLREIIERVVDAAADRYAVLRALYDAYRQRALHLLKPKGTDGGPADFGDHPLLPDGYDRFDPRAHDNERGELSVDELRHVQNDLRSLKSEVETEQIEATQAGRPREHDYHAIMAAFEAENPEPPWREIDSHAEWEWRRLEHYYEATDSAQLHRHRMERGAFMDRSAAELRRRAGILGPPRDPTAPRPKPQPRTRPEWPVGDGVSEIRSARDEDRDVYPEDEMEHAFDEPSYDRAEDLSAASIGWTLSLDNDQYAAARAAIEALQDAAGGVRRSYCDEYRPGTIGRAQLDIREGLLHCDDALAHLDALRGHDWLTDAADRRLRELIEALRDTATDRYAELRALYDAYRERALRILGPEGVAGV